MIVIGCDLGNKSRNSLAVVNDNGDLLDWSRITYNSKDITPWQHRKNILTNIQDYINKYSPDYILFEKVNLFVGRHISKLNNIMSLAFLQASIINEFSEHIGIAEVDVRSWKSCILKNGNATKDDSVNYVLQRYPEVNLEIVVPHKRKANEVIIDNDTADAICIANCAIYKGIDWLNNNKVNFN